MSIYNDIPKFTFILIEVSDVVVRGLCVSSSKSSEKSILALKNKVHNHDEEFDNKLTTSFSSFSCFLWFVTQNEIIFLSTSQMIWEVANIPPTPEHSFNKNCQIDSRSWFTMTLNADMSYLKYIPEKEVPWVEKYRIWIFVLLNVKLNQMSFNLPGMPLLPTA